jgi:hypothetical protein
MLSEKVAVLERLPVSVILAQYTPAVNALDSWGVAPTLAGADDSVVHPVPDGSPTLNNIEADVGPLASVSASNVRDTVPSRGVVKE